MSNTTFQELKNHVRISDVAEYIGYRLNTGAGKKYLEYRLFNGGTKVDEIVIYTTSYSQTFFSRNGYGDKGDVVNFILNRLHLFRVIKVSDMMQLPIFYTSYQVNSQNMKTT